MNNLKSHTYKINRVDFEKRNQHRGIAPWFVGLSGSGKSTIANGQEIDAMVCWMGENQMRLNAKYGIQHTTRLGRAIIKEIIYVVDLNELNRIEGQTSIQKNDIARIKIKTTTPLFFDSYRKNRNTGSFIIIDETNNNTLGAGMII